MRLVRISSNKESFKEVMFKDGLNLVVADRTETSAATDSRNGVGKTTLFQIIDYCLGGQVREGDSLKKLEGGGWEFSLDTTIRGSAVRITRSVDETDVRISGELEQLGLAPAEGAERRIGPGQWADWLGTEHFNLAPRGLRAAYEPTFRGLVRHFLRFRKDSYFDPFATFSGQPPAQVQVENAFLLGLDWRLAVQWQQIKDRAKTLEILAKSDVEELGTTLAEVQSRRARETAQLARLSESIAEFRVLPQYQETQVRANAAADQMRRLANQVLLTDRELTLYREQLDVTTVEHRADVERLFAEVGVVFGENLVRALDEVEHFHQTVARNRSAYLEAEITRLERLQTERGRHLQELEDSRQRDMLLLQSHGALEDYAALQQRAGMLSASIEAAAVRIDEIQAIRRGKTAIKSDIIELQVRAERDLDERREALSEILGNFSAVFEELYGTPADLLVETTEAGYKFRAALPREGSTGTGKMGIFAYDLVIAQAWTMRGKGPGFLAHDSVLFDGVDERQTAAAIALAAASASTEGFQYILTANSDDLTESEFERVKLPLDKHVVLRLTDADESGGILGVRV